jgi:hypothetical protein
VLTRRVGDDGAVDRLAVEDDLLHTLLGAGGLGDVDVVGAFAELSGDLEITEAVRYAGVNL